MIAGTIEGWNAAPGAPANWNPERDGECGALPVRVTHHADGIVAYCESAWVPSAEDIRNLIIGQPVILRVVGWQPAVCVFIETPDESMNPLGLGVQDWDLNELSVVRRVLDLGMVANTKVLELEMARYRQARQEAEERETAETLAAAIETAEQQ